MEAAVAIGVIAVLFYVLILGFTLLMSVGMYVLEAFGLYNMGKSIKHPTPYYGWIPILNLILIGDLAGEVKLFSKTYNGRKLAYFNLIITAVYLIVYFIFLIFQIFSTIGGAGWIGVIFALVFAALALVFSVVSTVIYYVLYYHIFKRFDPGKEVLYILLSIFVSVSLPIILFILGRKALKDQTRMTNV